MIVKLLTEHHLEFLSLKGGGRGSSESTLFKMPHCWKSHAQAQMTMIRKCYNHRPQANLEERGCSVMECLTRNQGVASSSLTRGTVLVP